jgi:hypothetical protein
MAQLPQLEELQLGNLSINHDVFASGFSKLKKLRIYYCDELSDKALMSMSHLS